MDFRDFYKTYSMITNGMARLYVWTLKSNLVIMKPINKNKVYNNILTWNKYPNIALFIHKHILS